MSTGNANFELPFRIQDISRQLFEPINVVLVGHVHQLQTILHFKGTFSQKKKLCEIIALNYAVSLGLN
jgi:hypothetical protein